MEKMIRTYFKKLGSDWKVLLKDSTFNISLLVGLILLASAFLLNHYASVYNDSETFISVGDAILDNIPTYNMEFFYSWVMYGLVALVIIYPVFVKPEIIPFALKTFAILYFLRSGFIILTDFGPPFGHFYDLSAPGEDVLSHFIFRNDLFFSGHTAVPFMGFLLFRKSKLRWVLLAGTFVEAATVLLMHIHYSIDVFAAPFIASGVYSLSDKLFNNLNLRFSERVRLFGWRSALRKKISNLKDRRRQRTPEKISEGEFII